VSHGCVRLHPANAAKLYALVERMGVTNATVVVTSGKD
jgi:lipoprotein-anchoring transpeptidase ErfK/SrfK